MPIHIITLFVGKSLEVCVCVLGNEPAVALTQIPVLG